MNHPGPPDSGPDFFVTTLLGIDACFLRQPHPFLGFGVNEGRKLLRWLPAWLGSEIAQPNHDVGRLEHLNQRTVELCVNIAWRSFGKEKSIPGRDVVAGQSGFRERRQVRK